MTWFIGLVVVLAIVFFWFLGVYNKLIRLIEAVNNNQRQIDIQLDRRFKVFESLISAVKKYMDYEKTTLKEVVALRSAAQDAKQSGDPQARMAAENKISHIAGGINVMFEQYPDLKANTNVLQLQEEIVSTENKLAYAKQAFNDSIEHYNVMKKSFFESFVVGMCASLNKNFEYWRIGEEKVAKMEEYTVQL